MTYCIGIHSVTDNHVQEHNSPQSYVNNKKTHNILQINSNNYQLINISVITHAQNM